MIEPDEWTVYPIYTRETAIHRNTSYFKSLTHKQAGDINLPVGKLLASYANQCSYFVVRRSHRRTKYAQWRQHGSLVNPPQRSTARYYVVDHFEYIVAVQEWDSGKVHELESFALRFHANKALREYHASNQIAAS